MALLTFAQVKNPAALFAIVTDLLTDIQSLRTTLNALVADTADQRVAIEQGLVDSAASKAEVDKLFTDISAVEAVVDAASHNTTSISASQLGALTQAATETQTSASVATLLTRQGDAKSTDRAIL